MSDVFKTRYVREKTILNYILGPKLSEFLRKIRKLDRIIDTIIETRIWNSFGLLLNELIKYI